MALPSSPPCPRSLLSANPSNCQICDFGYSKHEKYQSAPGSRVGTPAYLAPEVIMTTKGKTYDGKVRGGIWMWGRAVPSILAGTVHCGCAGWGSPLWLLGPSGASLVAAP